MENRAEFAARAIEQQIVAPNAPPKRLPNYDIFKAFQVSDSSAGTTQQLALINAAVFSGGKLQTPIALKGIPRDVTFNATLTFDSALLDNFGPKKLHWDEMHQLKWLRNVRAFANNWSRQRIRAEYQYWQARDAAMELAYLALFNTTTAV